MRKIVLIFISVISLLSIFSFNAVATESAEEIYSDTEDKLFSLIDGETIEILEDFEINGLDYESINKISFKNIIDYFKEDFKSKLAEIVKFTLILTVVLLLMSLITLPSDAKNKDLIEFISVSVIIVISVPRLIDIVNVSLSVIDTGSKFLLGYIPIFAALLALSGNTATALSYNTLLLTVSELISRFVTVLAENLTGAYFSLTIGFSLSSNISLSRFVNSFSRITSLIIGFLSSLFASFLTVKSVFSANIDTVGAKGIRFVISSLIPVVGSAISDAYSTLVGSIGVVKSSVAVVGIFVSIIINLPTLFEGMCFCLSFNFLSFMAETLRGERISAVLKAFSSGIKFLLLIQIFLMFILIVSTAVMVNVKSAV